MKNQQQKRPHLNDHSVENDTHGVKSQLADIPSAVTRAMRKDFFEAALKKTAPDQIAGREKKSSPQHQLSGDLSEGEAVSLQEPSEKPQPVTIEHREYFRSIQRPEQQVEQRENMETRQQIEMLQSEIKKLIKASKEMETAFKQVANQVTVESAPQEVGKYHVNFLEWVLLTVRSARIRIEEGQTWMSLFASKKKQKGYWAQAKKHGTSFTLNNERTAATQTG